MIEFNNREISTLVWSAIGLIWAASDNERRGLLWNATKAFCAHQILISVALMLAYIGLCVLLLSAFQVWHWDNLKTTLVWCMTFAFVTMFDLSRISEDDTFYAKSVRDTLCGTALVLYVAEFKSFPVIVELLIVPLTLILGMSLALVQTRKDLNGAKGLVEGIATLFGLTLLGFSVREVWQNPETFLAWDTAREYCIPIFLSLLFLPFIYLLSGYVIYERLWIRLSFAWPDKSLRQYAGSKAAFAFAGDLDALRRWARNVGMMSVATREDIDRSIREVLEAKRRERTRAHVPINQGWSPYTAIEFLKDQNLATDDYHRSYDDMWYASSKTLEVDDAILPSTVRYIVEGSTLSATRLKMKLKVFITKQEAERDKQGALEEFSRLARHLIQTATPDIDAEHSSGLIRGGVKTTRSGLYADVRFARVSWANANLRGFDVLLTITHRYHHDDAAERLLTDA